MVLCQSMSAIALGVSTTSEQSIACEVEPEIERLT